MLNDKSFGLRRYNSFISKVVQSDCIYCMFHYEREYLYSTESHEFYNAQGETTIVFPFWSNKAYPRNWLYGYQEQGFDLRPLTLDDFLDLLLEISESPYDVVGIEWNAQGVGYESLAVDVYNDIVKFIDSITKNER